MSNFLLERFFLRYLYAKQAEGEKNFKYIHLADLFRLKGHGATLEELKDALDCLEDRNAIASTYRIPGSQEILTEKAYVPWGYQV